MKYVVVEPDGAGGMVHYAYQLCTALAAEQVDVTLITGRHYELAHLPHDFEVDARIDLWPAVGERAPRSRLSALLVGLYRKVRRITRGVRYIREWSRLTRHLVAMEPDVVQFAIIRFPFQALYLRRLRRAGIHLVQICHEFEPRERSGPARALNRALSQAVYRSFDRIYLHGEAVRSEFLEAFDVDPERTSSIPHGNEAMFLHLTAAGRRPRFTAPDGRPLALFFGGLRPSKGLDDLLDAWTMVAAETDAHLLVCGQPAGVDPVALQETAQDAGIGDRVTIDAGYTPLEDVAGLFTAADVVVLPYRSATASGVLQIAYAFGRPVVATAVGALAEDVESGRTGMLVPPGDPHALARGLIKILSNGDEASRMGDEARAASDRFDWSEIAGTILEDARKALP